MSMRAQFARTVESLLATNRDLVVLLGDIGVFGFRKAIEQYPDRVVNIGILEQSTVSVAAGLAKCDLLPVVHTIAPFLVERAFEQLKIDFGYQRQRGNFVSVGASYDYASLGCTHHCPGDVALLQTIPGVEIVVPGTAAEFDALFRATFADDHPTYFRLSERENEQSQAVVFGRANVLQEGGRATVIAVGPTLQHVLAATRDMDVAVLYYTTIEPFDAGTLRAHIRTPGKVLIVEPFYAGTLAWNVCEACRPLPLAIDSIGVPRAFLTNYGRAEDHDEAIGLLPAQIRTNLERLIDA